MNFTCSVCGGEHDFGDTSYFSPEPDPWRFLSEEEREASFLDDDLCTMVTREGTHHFIRGCLNIPIRDHGLEVTWGVWCSVSEGFPLRDRRALVRLEKADHPLAQHQHHGVPENVMRRIYELILHDRSEVKA